jgi:hypothetical protein
VERVVEVLVIMVMVMLHQTPPWFWVGLVLVEVIVV